MERTILIDPEEENDLLVVVDKGRLVPPVSEDDQECRKEDTELNPHPPPPPPLLRTCCTPARTWIPNATNSLLSSMGKSLDPSLSCWEEVLVPLSVISSLREENERMCEEAERELSNSMLSGPESYQTALHISRERAEQTCRRYEEEVAGLLSSGLKGMQEATGICQAVSTFEKLDEEADRIKKMVASLPMGPHSEEWCKRVDEIVDSELDTAKRELKKEHLCRPLTELKLVAPSPSLEEGNDSSAALRSLCRLKKRRVDLDAYDAMLRGAAGTAGWVGVEVV